MIKTCFLQIIDRQQFLSNYSVHENLSCQSQPANNMMLVNNKNMSQTCLRQLLISPQKRGMTVSFRNTIFLYNSDTGAQVSIFYQHM